MPTDRFKQLSESKIKRVMAPGHVNQEAQEKPPEEEHPEDAKFPKPLESPELIDEKVESNLSVRWLSQAGHLAEF